MYFILSKTLLFLLHPFNWVIACLLIAIFAKRSSLKRKCFITGIAFLIIFSNPGLLYLFAKHWDVGRATITKGRVYSAAIVLGGFLGEDGKGKGVFNESAHRFIQGLELKERGVASHLLITSGNSDLRPDSFREAVWAKNVLKEFSLPDSSILIEQNARNTFENAAFSKQLLLSRHLPPPYLLVTSAWHMRRAQYIFKKAGIDVIACPSGAIAGDSNLSFIDALMPDAGIFSEWNLYLKELVGWTVAHLK
jgi:uncharacterized SAM-binding protein YcdF (DUF218 family)